MQVLASIFKGLGRLFLQPIFLIILLVIMSGSGIYLFTQNKSISGELNRLKGDPNAVAQKEVEDLIAKVSALVDIPSGEVPTLATVTDVDSVRDQAFFANAQNGDRVLIYTEALKAILYRPETNKIIEIAPVNIGQQERLSQEQEQEGSGEESSVPTVIRLALSNGTTTAGLTSSASDFIKEKISDLEFDVVSRTDAKGNFESTTVVVLNEGFDLAASTIAKTIKASVGELPEGESTPDADILVILGDDYSSE